MSKDSNFEIVDLKLADLPDTMQHLSLPVSELNEELFEENTGFDGVQYQRLPVHR